MGRVLTNAVTLACADELTPGVLPGGPIWFLQEPNNIGKFGPSVKKIARLPISKNRQPRKPALVDLDSTVDFEADVTYDHIRRFASGLFFSATKGGLSFVVTGVTATGVTVAANGALPQNTLVVVRGSGQAANNGLKVLVAGSIATEIRFAGTVIEAVSPTNCIAEVAGFQGVAADITMDASGNLLATALNFTTLNLTVGQWLFVGGDSTNATLNFATAADRGLARIKVIAAGKLTLDKRSAVWTVDAGAAKTIQLLFGRFLRNVPVDHADYLETTYQFEMAYKNLQVPGPGDEYEYAIGNFCNEITFNLPLTNKATMKANFIGLSTANPTSVRATNGGTPILPVASNAYNTSSNFLRLRVTNVDETGVSTDFSALSVGMKNQVTAEKVIGTLGGKYMNAGEIDVTVTATLLFTSDVVVAAIRDNRQVTMEFCVANEDGGMLIDLPALTIAGGDKGFPMNRTMTVAMTATAFQDPTLGDCISMSIFPYIPLN